MRMKLKIEIGINFNMEISMVATQDFLWEQTIFINQPAAN